MPASAVICPRHGTNIPSYSFTSMEDSSCQMYFPADTIDRSASKGLIELARESPLALKIRGQGNLRQSKAVQHFLQDFAAGPNESCTNDD